jgi:hypothetical protein
MHFLTKQATLMRRLTVQTLPLQLVFPGPANLPRYVLLVLLLATAKILAAKLGTFIDPASLPCQPTCLVSPLALSAHLPCQPAFCTGQPALF